MRKLEMSRENFIQWLYDIASILEDENDEDCIPHAIKLIKYYLKELGEQI